MQNPYSMPRSKRKEIMDNSGKCQGGKLVPIAIVPFRSNESGIIQQNVQVELEPVAGRLITGVTARITAVYVPIRAVDAFINAATTYPGNEEILRERMMNKEMLFPFEAETAISRIMNIVPKSIGGVKSVISLPRQAHNCAVNYLRRRKYIDAAQITTANTQVTPAIIKHSVLDHFNGVLDPDEHIDGAVSLEGTIPVKGLAIANSKKGASAPMPGMLDASGTNYYPAGWNIKSENDPALAGQAALIVEKKGNSNAPNVRIEFGTGEAGPELSLRQFYIAEQMDKFARMMRELVDRYPEYGEEIVAKMVHGLQIDSGRMPYVVYETSTYLNRGIQSAMDGPSLDLRNTNVYGDVGFSVPIAPNEFGGVVITFLEIKPDEIISNQPHPILTSPWEVENHVAEELELEPVPVTYRELDCDVSVGQEGTIAFYTGYNHMKRQYARSGYTRETNLATVEHRNALWQYSLPLSVSPENILYPASLEHYPFALNGDEDNAVSYRIVSDSMIQSPMILGPTPVERLDALNDDDIFEDNDD